MDRPLLLGADSSSGRHIRRKPLPSSQLPVSLVDAPTQADDALAPSPDPSIRIFPVPQSVSSLSAQTSFESPLTHFTNKTQFHVPATQLEYHPLGHPLGVGVAPVPRRRRFRRALLKILKGWWEEILWCLISITCVVALVLLLKAFDDQPLPIWPLGITLNTVVAFLSTFCRTSFILPVTQGLSQAKWNWFKQSPRPLKDLLVFDQASRGPWGSVKLLIAVKGRVVGILSAVLLITGIATSTLTQSLITYPTRGVKLPGNDTALAFRNTGYFWASANWQSRRDIMYPIHMMFSKASSIPPEEVLAYELPSCRTSNCTWNQFSSLAVCIDMTNVTHLVETTPNPIDPAQNWTAQLPNGVHMDRGRYGFGYMNVSAGPSLSYNGTEIQKASIYDFFVLYYQGRQPRAIEIIFHWCVHTYNVSVVENVPSLRPVSTFVMVDQGETLVRHYNQTMNVTYLVTPDDPGVTYVADGMGVGSIESLLDESFSGYYIDTTEPTFGNANELLGMAISRSTIGFSNIKDTQIQDDREWMAAKNFTQNIANGLTNAMLNANISGDAWIRETFISIHWPWLSLLAAQVGLSIITLILIIVQTAMLDIDIVKESPLPGLLAMSTGEKEKLEMQLGGGNVTSRTGAAELAHAQGITGQLRRRGDKWVLEEEKVKGWN